jgi:putative ABC transport system permease protein
MVLLITLLVGFISGSYPSFYLSSFIPMTVLKGTVSKAGRKSGFLRRALVVIQFFIAIIMIIGTIVVSSQLKFLRNTDLGFKKENLVVMELQDSTFRSKAEAFRNELLQNPAVISVTNSAGVPGEINWIQVLRVEREDEMAEMALILAQTDYDFVKTMGMEIIKGRDFDRNMGTDKTEAALINETGVKTLGWEDDPVGKKLQYGFDLEGDEGRIMKVIGVVKDFHYRSLHNKIEPVIFFISPEPRWLMTARIDEGKEKEALAFIEEKWNSFGAGRPFDFRYVTQILEEQYEGEQKIGVIFNIATIIAVPVAWWRLDIWLSESFIYHTSLNWYYFILAGLLSFVVGMATISFYIIRAASSNPVDAVKWE